MLVTLGAGRCEHHPTVITIRSSRGHDSVTACALWRASTHVNPVSRDPHPGWDECNGLKEDDMGFLDDAKDAAEATGKKVGEWADDTKERVSDKVDEVQADAEVKKAEADRDRVHAKNDYKEKLRED